MHNIPELEVVLNKCLSCNDNNIAINALQLLEKFYLTDSVMNYTQLDEGWEKDFDPKYPMKFYYSLKKLRNAQRNYIQRMEEEDEDDYGDENRYVEGEDNSDSSSESSSESDNNYPHRRNRKRKNPMKRQMQCGPYDQFIALGGIRMLFNFITEFDPNNFEDTQQCYTYMEVCNCLFEENQLIGSEFPIDLLINTLINHVIAIFNFLPKHMNIDEINRLHEIQVRKKKRDSKYSTLYNSDDEENNNNNNGNSNNDKLNDSYCNEMQMKILTDIYEKVHKLFQSNPVDVGDDILKQIMYVGVLSIPNIDIRNTSYGMLFSLSRNDRKRLYNIFTTLFQQENIRELY